MLGISDLTNQTELGDAMRSSESLRLGGAFIAVGSLALVLAGTAVVATPYQSRPFDVLLVGGRVIDGTGNPWFYADVGLRDGRIVAVGDLDGAEAVRAIDVTDKVTVPGFIDLHSHANGRNGLRAPDKHRRAAPNMIAQGATTLVVNQDGRSDQEGISHQRAELEELGFGPNVALMVGHNTIRGMALGDDYRRIATDAEIDKMRALLVEGLEAGAYGLSAGLEYVPGRWSVPSELHALVREVAPFGGVYIVHERAGGADPMWYVPSQHEPGPPSMLDNIIEAIDVAEQSGVPTVATHIKVRGNDFWGSSGAIISLIERARTRGVEIWADQYPYNTSGSDGSTVLIPDWALERDRWTAFERDSGARPPDFASHLRTILQDSEARKALELDINREISRRGGPDNIVIFDHPDEELVGLSLNAVARLKHVSPLQAAILLQLEGFSDRAGGGRMRGFSMSEIDVEALAAQPWTATASDAGIALPGDGPVHARYYGTFPRKIRHYAIDRGILSIESAVRAATSLPAQILRLQDRGIVREGFHADLAVLDLKALRDTADFVDPYQAPEGVDYVFVNGEMAVDDGHLTNVLAGVILTPRRR